MPIYGYRCKQCDHEFEIVQRMVDDPLKTCPECMGPLQKQLYPAGIVFKGSGFYKTDYASPTAKESSSNGEAGGSDSSKSDSGKSDSGKSESGKSESGKSESGKSESGKSESSKSDSGKSESSKSEAPKKDSKAGSSGSKE